METAQDSLIGNNLSRRLLSILVISLLFSIILHVPVCFYAYYSYPYSGEFRLEETPLDLNPECQSCFKSYRGATLNGYFKTENIFRIGVKYENVWNDNSNIENIVMFQIGLVGKEGLDIDNDFGLLDGLFVSMKYYKGYKCLVVENGTTVLFRHKVSYLSEKLCYHDILSFERKNGNLYVHYDIQNTTHIPLVFVAFKDLTSYSFIAGLGYPSFTLVAMTLHGTTLTSKFHKDMYISSKGKVLSNYNIGLEYKSSFADTPIHKTTEFGQSILQVKAKIFFKPNSYYGDKEEKDLFELGLAPMNLISRNMPLRNAKDTVLIQVRLEWRTSSIRKLHLYTWENGSIRQHRELPHNILQKDKSIMLHFKFNINSEAKRIELSTDNYSYDTMNHYLYVFENFEFNNILYPFVRKETIFPIRMFYTIRKSTINPVNRKYELHPVALYIFLRSGK